MIMQIRLHNVRLVVRLTECFCNVLLYVNCKGHNTQAHVIGLQSAQPRRIDCRVAWQFQFCRQFPRSFATYAVFRIVFDSLAVKIAQIARFFIYTTRVMLADFVSQVWLLQLNRLSNIDSIECIIRLMHWLNHVTGDSALKIVGVIIIIIIIISRPY